MYLVLKSNIPFIIIIIVLLYRFNLYAQPSTFFDDFESYTTTPLVCQNPIDWWTWTGPCGTIEDPYISTNFAYSGTKSVLIVHDNDLVKPLGDVTNGKWSISFKFLIPAGKTGYFNTLNIFAPPQYSWAMDCYFNSGGVGELIHGSTSIIFQWIEDSWQSVLLYVDLDCNEASFYFDKGSGFEIIGDPWQWALAPNIILSANDFYGYLSTNEMYIDDYRFSNNFAASTDVVNGWNLVSIPGLHPIDQNVNTWWQYRDMTANVFKYCNGFVATTTLTPGCAYWMKHSGARTYNTGDEWPEIIYAPCPTVGVCCSPANPGWNLIGPFDRPVLANEITTNPPGLISGQIYGYSGGYYVATLLLPGKGYWIKLSGAGEIILP